MKSFAQLKREFTEGATIKTVLNAYKPEKAGEIRKIAKAQTNAIAFETPNTKSGVSWLWWDKKHYNYLYDGDILQVAEKETNKIAFIYEKLEA